MLLFRPWLVPGGPLLLVPGDDQSELPACRTLIKGASTSCSIFASNTTAEPEMSRRCSGRSPRLSRSTSSAPCSHPAWPRPGYSLKSNDEAQISKLCVHYGLLSSDRGRRLSRCTRRHHSTHSVSESRDSSDVSRFLIYRVIAHCDPIRVCMFYRMDRMPSKGGSTRCGKQR